MNQSPVSIIGAGGHGFVVASTLLAAGYEVAGYYDDDESKWGQMFLGFPVIGAVSELAAKPRSDAVIGVGNNKIRKKLAEELDLNWVTPIHPFSWVDPSAEIGIGTVVFAGAIIQTHARVGSHVIVNTKASIDHDTRVDDYVHIAVAHLAGGSSAGEGSFLALGSTILPGLRIGAWSVVGAGATVTKDVPPETTVVGSPAKPLGQKKQA